MELASLTPTERRVAELVADGLRYKQVAHRISAERATTMSRRTVEWHVCNIIRKLNVNANEDDRQLDPKQHIILYMFWVRRTEETHSTAA